MAEETKKPVNCPACRAGDHDSCYFIAEVDRDRNPVLCHCFDTDHEQERA